ncbi:MAG: SH3 domain-containing protein [Treponema sp.]|nr:SH3 domain-containing protein [Treponema sp.]
MSKSYWISSYYYDVLKSQDKNILFDKEKGWIKSWSPSTDEKLSEIILPTLFYLTENLVYISSFSAFGTRFLIESDSEFEQSILLNCYLNPHFLNDRYKFWDEDDFIRKINDKEHVSLRLTFDGDYMKLYEGSSNELLETFARIRKDDYKIVTNKLRQIVGDKEILMDDITFPRHADGTCDYDDKIIKIHKVGGMYKTEDNIRLRAAEGTTGDALATLAAGTRVKVEAVGKEETIDGITSNWVQVSVLDGAKDKDGNAIASGTKGWLFGGYLSTTEYVEPVKEEKKLNLLDSVETKDERKVNRAAKMNKKEENDDFVFPFIQVGFGIILIIVLLPIILVIANKRKGDKK